MRPQYGREDDARVAHVACMGDSIASTAGKPQPRAGAGDNGTHRPCCTKALTQPPPLTTSASPRPPKPLQVLLNPRHAAARQLAYNTPDDLDELQARRLSASAKKRAAKKRKRTGASLEALL